MTDADIRDMIETSLGKSTWVPRTSNAEDIVFQAVDWYPHDVDNPEALEIRKERRKQAAERKAARDAGRRYEAPPGSRVDDDVESSNFVIEAFGVTARGETCSITFEKYTPNFFVELPCHLSSEMECELHEVLKQLLPKYMQSDFVGGCQVQKYAFHGYQWNTPRWFLELIFHNDRARKRLARQLDEPVMMMNCSPQLRRLFGGKMQHLFSRYENNVEPLLRFFHKNNLNPCGWIRIPAGKYKRVRRGDAKKRTHIDAQCHFRHAAHVEEDALGPLMMCCYDIECESSHGDFPQATKDYSKPVHEVISAFIWHVEQNRPVTATTIDRWLRICFGLTKPLKTDPHKVQHELSHIFTTTPLSDDANDPRGTFRMMLRKLSTEVFMLLDTAVSSKLHEGDIINVKLPGRNAFKDEIIAIAEDYAETCDAATEDQAPRDKVGLGRSTSRVRKTVYTLKKTKGYARLADDLATTASSQEATRDKVIPIDRIGPPRDFAALKKTEWKRRKAALTSKMLERFRWHTCHSGLNRIEGDRVIQIGSVFWRLGEKDPCLRHLLAMGTCDPIDGVVVESFTSEKALLCRWSQLIREMSPHVLTGYNIFGFDARFMWQRADELGCPGSFGDLSPMTKYVTTIPHARHSRTQRTLVK